MTLDEIMEQAKDNALKAVIESGKSTLDCSKLAPEMREDVELYRPVINYIDTLVAEALRLYHENQSKIR